jgi:hypothetical protein
MERRTRREHFVRTTGARPKITLWQEFADFGEELARAIWLGHIGITARFAAFVFITAQGIGSDGNDRNRPKRRVRLYPGVAS